MQKWIVDKKSNENDFFQAMSQISQDAIKYAIDNWEEFQEYFCENAGQHGGSISNSTKAFMIECFYEDKKCP